MSLAIDTNTITRVLLADGWHTVLNNSFDIDSYEYLWQDRPVLVGGQDNHIAAAGFTFLSSDGRISGPLTSVLAVTTR